MISFFLSYNMIFPQVSSNNFVARLQVTLSFKCRFACILYIDALIPHCCGAVLFLYYVTGKSRADICRCRLVLQLTACAAACLKRKKNKLSSALNLERDLLQCSFLMYLTSILFPFILFILDGFFFIFARKLYVFCIIKRYKRRSVESKKRGEKHISDLFTLLSLYTSCALLLISEQRSKKKDRR